MQNVLIVIHVIISLILVVVVLMQHGKQQGLSGSIAGGAETFFGKNKGRTVDAMLKKFTSVIAALFIISSVALAFVSVSEYKASSNAADTETTQTAEDGQTSASLDENGNLVDAEGNVLMTAEQMQEQLDSAETEGAANAETENAETENTETK